MSPEESIQYHKVEKPDWLFCFVQKVYLNQITCPIMPRERWANWTISKYLKFRFFKSILKDK